MPRVKRGTTKKRRHSKVLAQAKGHYQVRSKHYKAAKESVIHASMYSYAHRRERKGDMRKLWTVRVNAGAHQDGLSYSQFIHGLKVAGIEVNRKVLADLAVREPKDFSYLAKLARETFTAG